LDKLIHISNQYMQINPKHHWWQRHKFWATFFPIASETERIPTLPMHKRSGGLDDTLIEGFLWLTRDHPARLPLLVGMPKLARVEQTDTFEVVLSSEF